MVFSAARRRSITAALLLGTFLASLEVMIVTPAVPVMVGELGGAGLYPWVFTAYILAKVPMMPIYGRMSDRAGRRDTYLVGLGIFLLGSVCCALATTMGGLIAARAVQGVGGAALVVLTMTIFGDLYPVAERTKMQGMFSLVWGVSSLLGPLVGGWLTETWSWRAVFWINVLPGLGAAATIAVLVPRAMGRREAVAAGPEIWALLRVPTQQAVLASGLFIGASLTGVIAYLPVQIQAVQGGNAIDAGLALIPLSIAWTITAIVAGRMVNRVGFQTLARLGVIISTVGAIIAAEWPVAQPGLVLFGIGMGFTISIFNVACQETAPVALRGTATSLALVMRSLGAGIGMVVFGLLAGFEPGVVDFSGIPDLSRSVAGIFESIATCMGLAAFIVLVRMPRDDQAGLVSRRPA